MPSIPKGRYNRGSRRDWGGLPNCLEIKTLHSVSLALVRPIWYAIVSGLKAHLLTAQNRKVVGL